MDIKLPLEKILNYKGNRYELARACIEYAKCVRYLHEDDRINSQAKEVLVALTSVLENKVKYTSDKILIEIHQDEVEFLRNMNNESIERQKQRRSRTSMLLDEANQYVEEDEPYTIPVPVPAENTSPDGTEDSPNELEDSLADTEDSPNELEDSLADTEDSPNELEDSLADTEDSPNELEDSLADTEDSPNELKDSLADTEDSPNELKDSLADTEDSPNELEDSLADTEDSHSLQKDSERDQTEMSSDNDSETATSLS